MGAAIIERQEGSISIRIEVTLSRSMLDTEEVIQQALNEAGVLATTAALEQFDTDGSPLEMGATRWTSKGEEPKAYQTPYGEAVVHRHVYQTSAGGAIRSPVEIRSELGTKGKNGGVISFPNAKGHAGAEHLRKV